MRMRWRVAAGDERGKMGDERRIPAEIQPLSAQGRRVGVSAVSGVDGSARGFGLVALLEAGDEVDAHRGFQ